MTLADLVRHPLFISGCSLVVGTLLGSLVHRLRNRMSRISYFAVVNRIALSVNDPVFGSIRVLVNNNDVKSLYIVNIVFENMSSVDLDDLDLRAYVDQGTTIISERSAVLGTSFIVPWSESFKQSIAVAPGATPTPLQVNTYFHSREYRLQALNRFQSAQLTYLCTRPADDQAPTVYMESPSKGVRIKRVPNPVTVNRPVLGIPIRKALIPGLVTALTVATTATLLLKSVPAAAAVCMVTGLFAVAIGAFERKVAQVIRRVLS